MSKLKVPSLQHLSRLWKPSVEQVQKGLVHLANNSPNFSYSPLYGVVTDMIVLRQPYEEIEKSIKAIKREDVRNNFLGILPLLREHFDKVPPSFVQKVTTRFYPVARGLMIPFEPPLMYGDGGRIIFPWFIFWKENPLNAKQLSLFVTIVSEVLAQDPDLENAKFEILDFSAPEKGGDRILRVIDAADIPKLDQDEKNRMLEIFAEGFFKAEEELFRKGSKRPEKSSSPTEYDPNQLQLF